MVLKGIENDSEMIQHYLDIGKYETVASLLDKVFEDDPDNATALFQMGIVEMSRRNYLEARGYCREALHLGYDESKAMHLIGFSYHREGKLEEAEEALLRALQLTPRDSELITSYGALMLQTGQEEKALAALERAREINPSNIRVNQFLCEFYVAIYDATVQQVHINNVMESAEEEVQSLVYTGMFHALKGEVKKTRQCYQQALLLQQEDANILALLACHDSLTHPLFAPFRLVDKIGRRSIVFIGAMVLVMLLAVLQLFVPAMIVFFTALLFVIYSWIVPILYKTRMRKALESNA
ncbi:tetratricopeptide repeat protein [Virgibacillus sp. LDC-1]|uniref:tetratricopeptide repeat protein n=1 Tax=Virgibacillus sp. LDC-1 TaxID=3039856 RepID=UPI0024DEFD0C|nr:tetratricopeptide repeat protein [Virgibacillus sp. LDC-1]